MLVSLFGRFFGLSATLQSSALAASSLMQHTRCDAWVHC